MPGNARWNYLGISKLQRCNRCSLGWISKFMHCKQCNFPMKLPWTCKFSPIVILYQLMYKCLTYQMVLLMLQAPGRQNKAITGWLGGMCLAKECSSGLIPGLRPASERRCYFVTTSLIGWVQTWNQPCGLFLSPENLIRMTSRDGQRDGQTSKMAHTGWLTDSCIHHL